MYRYGKYKYYVVSKMLQEKTFVFEKDKLDILYPVYVEVFLTNWKDSSIEEYMQENEVFITSLIDEKLFVNISSEKRLLLTNALQSKESLVDLYENYSIDFCISYLESIKGFKDYYAVENDERWNTQPTATSTKEMNRI